MYICVCVCKLNIKHLVKCSYNFTVLKLQTLMYIL